MQKIRNRWSRGCRAGDIAAGPEAILEYFRKIGEIGISFVV